MTDKEAEHMRLYIKESGWALAHLKAYYESAKPEDAPKVDDDETEPKTKAAPRRRKQLSLFEEPERNQNNEKDSIS